MNDVYSIALKNRGLIHVEGKDRLEFLQGLITNDIEKLRPGAALYACLLSAQGKFLHDFFITTGDTFLLIDCEGASRAADLFRRLNMYRLRKDVQISVEENAPVYAGFGPMPEDAMADPRHPDMGWRTLNKPEMPEAPFEDWDARRISLCIPDGSRDLIPEKSTMDEGRMDQINAIDYNKGCYVGQELTARMHYRGLGKKHLYAVTGKNLPAPGSEITHEGQVIGEMRSSCGDVGMALIKDEAVAQATLPGFKILDS